VVLRVATLAKTMSAAIALLISNSSLGASDPSPNDRPYTQLRDGYAAADPVQAAAAYSEDATYAELYPGVDPALRTGQTAIAAGFAELFRTLDLRRPGNKADLNFRFVTRGKFGDAGFYRLRIGSGASAVAYYGSFATHVSSGLFVNDTSGPGDRNGFEGAAGPVLFADDNEELDPAFYDQFLGVYGKPDCPIVITRSVRRLFALDECTGTWRGLQRQSGREWSAGQALIDPIPLARYSFAKKSSLSIAGSESAAPLTQFSAYRTEPLRFGKDSVLAGTLYLPNKSSGSRVPAVAMIHGSGPQDRHGYASLIGLMAQRLARNGIAVLAYDKRGVGGSSGDWTRAGFGDLAADAAAALTALRAHSAVDPVRVGLAGSSQAGWIAAEAIRSQADPAFVMLVGAAGSALSAAEQNLYNTRVRMKCAGIADGDIRLALDQQQAFFAARQDPNQNAALAALSARARMRPGLSDWLFPETIARGANSEWYDVLDVEFDPLPVWRSYSGKAYFLFGGADDSTPSAEAASRLATVRSAQVTVVPGMHHIGLKARSVCDSDIAGLGQFHPRFFATLDQWSREVTGPQ
jgi:pimeloyl-ACP methyl ester carboxylesterase